MNATRLYLRLLGVSVRSQMQYRVSFVLLSIGCLLATSIEILAIWALFGRFESLAGWTLAEVALFFGLVNVAFSLADGFGRGFDLFSRLVKSGEFDRLLLRPRSTALQVAGQELTLMRVGRLVQGLAVLRWASSGPRPASPWSWRRSSAERASSSACWSFRPPSPSGAPRRWS